LEKLACGRFSDISFVASRKKRGFCGLRIMAAQVRQAPRRLGAVPP
jgi:hypothetical protein